MRFLTICPFTRVVLDKNGPIEITDEEIERQIGCRVKEPVPLAEGVDMWLDEEGLLDPSGEQHFFTIGGTRRVFAGRAMICEKSDAGDFKSLREGITQEMIEKAIIWLGDETGLERSIKVALVDRPATYLHTGGRKQKLWEWRPTPVEVE